VELSADPGLTITVWTAEPGSKSAEALGLLGSWAATVEPANVAHTGRARPALAPATTGPNRR
jgi:hypothetical protein